MHAQSQLGGFCWDEEAPSLVGQATAHMQHWRGANGDESLGEVIAHAGAIGAIVRQGNNGIAKNLC